MPKELHGETGVVLQRVFFLEMKDSCKLETTIKSISSLFFLMFFSLHDSTSWRGQSLSMDLMLAHRYLMLH